MGDEEEPRTTLSWKHFPTYTELSSAGATVSFNEASTTVAIGEDPLPMDTGFFIEIKTETCNFYFKDSFMVGISNEQSHVGGAVSQIGKSSRSWGWRVDGKKQHNGILSDYSPPHTQQKKERDRDIIFNYAISFDPAERALSFWDNGFNRGVAFVLSKEDLDLGPLYPAVCFASSGHKATFVTDCGAGSIKPARK